MTFSEKMDCFFCVDKCGKKKRLKQKKGGINRYCILRVYLVMMSKCGLKDQRAPFKIHIFSKIFHTACTCPSNACFMALFVNLFFIKCIETEECRGREESKSKIYYVGHWARCSSS